MIRAVLFDAGATLVHPNPPVEEVYAREFSREGARFTGEDLGRALTRAWEEVRRSSSADRYGGIRGEPEFWRAFLSRVRGHLDGAAVPRESFDRLARHFRDPSSWEVYEDVPGTLDVLAARGYRLGVVSNWDSYLPALLGGLGLLPRFRVVAVSAIEETGKPEPEIFRRACERLRIAPSEALHVGDSLEEDYEGAKGAGLRAVLLDRVDRHPTVTERVRSLSELPGRLSGA